jgi:hypothetical protein
MAGIMNRHKKLAMRQPIAVSTPGATMPAVAPGAPAMLKKGGKVEKKGSGNPDIEHVGHRSPGSSKKDSEHHGGTHYKHGGSVHGAHKEAHKDGSSATSHHHSHKKSLHSHHHTGHKAAGSAHHYDQY